jgi:hypothetical protein
MTKHRLIVSTERSTLLNEMTHSSPALFGKKKQREALLMKSALFEKKKQREAQPTLIECLSIKEDT